MKRPDPLSTINDEWKFLAHHLRTVSGEPLNDLQLKEMKRTFFCGAWMFFQKTLELDEALPGRPAAQQAKIAQWTREMRGYIDALNEGSPHV